jgi:hypothetical protein
MQVGIGSCRIQGINFLKKLLYCRLWLYNKFVCLSFNLPDARIFPWYIKMVHLFKLKIFIIMYELWQISFCCIPVSLCIAVRKYQRLCRWFSSCVGIWCRWRTSACSAVSSDIFLTLLHISYWWHILALVGCGTEGHCTECWAGCCWVATHQSLLSHLF